MESRPSETTPEIDCDRSRRLIAAMVSRELSVTAQSALARHRRDCPQCDEAYRFQVREVAGQQQRMGSRERRAHPRDRFTPLWIPLLHRRRLLALRFLVVCALVFGATRLLGGFDGDPSLWVRAESGEVWIGGHPLEVGDSAEQAWRSDLIQTGAAGRATLELRGRRWDLEPDSDLLVESTLGRRTRLMRGAVGIAGELELHTPHGLVQLGPDAEARVEITESGLRVQSAAGRVAWISAAGARELRPGEAWSGHAATGIQRELAAAR
ncbi:MAG: FecR family protein [Planctomycetota bacterium]